MENTFFIYFVRINFWDDLDFKTLSWVVADLDVFVKLNKNTQVYSLKEIQLNVHYVVWY